MSLSSQMICVIFASLFWIRYENCMLQQQPISIPYLLQFHITTDCYEINKIHWQKTLLFLSITSATVKWKIIYFNPKYYQTLFLDGIFCLWSNNVYRNWNNLHVAWLWLSFNIIYIKILKFLHVLECKSWQSQAACVKHQAIISHITEITKSLLLHNRLLVSRLHLLGGHQF